MNIADLLHSLTVDGLTLTQEPAGSLKVLGPVHRLTPGQKQGLSDYKQTLLTLTSPPTCFIPWLSPEEKVEREAIQWADSRSPEVLEALTDAIEYYEAKARPPAFYLGLKTQQTFIGIEWAFLEAGEADPPCKRCGDRQTSLNIIHSGESLRRDCAYCGCFRNFPTWYNSDLTQKILANNSLGIRYNETSQGGEANAPAGSNDSPLTKQGARS